MKHTMLAIALGLLVGSGSARAEGSKDGKPLGTIPVRGETTEDMAASTPFSYTFVQAKYALTDIEHTDIGIDGFGVGGSFLFAPNLYVVGGYEQAETDEFSFGGPASTIEFTTFELGVGYRQGLAANVDLNAVIEMIQQDVEGTGELQGLSDDDNGYGIGAGLRYMVWPQVELFGSGSFVSIFDDHEALVSAGGRFHFSNLISAGASVVVGGDTATYNGSVRASF